MLSYKHLFFIYLLIFSGSTLAAGGEGHHPSIFDLKWSALNFIIFVSFLIYMLRKPLTTFFVTSAEFITEKSNFAELKDKEANIKLDMYREKIDNIQKEIDKIKRDAEEELEQYKSAYQKETQETIQRIISDNDNKLEYEKEMMVRSINKDLVEDIIAKAKNRISSDKQIKKATSEKLISNIS